MLNEGVAPKVDLVAQNLLCCFLTKVHAHLLHTDVHFTSRAETSGFYVSLFKVKPTVEDMPSGTSVFQSVTFTIQVLFTYEELLTLKTQELIDRIDGGIERLNIFS